MHRINATSAVLTLRELHDLLWARSLPAVCRQVGCDSAWLSAFCKYTGIPLPPASYWKNKRAGKRVHQKWLPKGLDPREKVAVLAEKQRRGEPAVLQVAAEEDVAALIEEIGQLEIRVDAADSPARLHPVVATTRRLAQKQARDEWSTRFNRLRRRAPFPQPVFVVEVGRNSVDRATHVLQALVSAVVDLGGDIDTSQGDVASVELLGERHRFRLRECVQRHREVEAGANPATETWRPTGVLELHLEACPTGDLLTKWRDGPHGMLEGQLRAILVEFVQHVQSTRTKNNARRKAEEKAQQEREGRRRAAQEAERARHRVGVLESLAMRHAAFVTVTQLLHACRATDAISADVADWLRVAEAAAAQLNPLAKGPQHLRDVVEKQVDDKMVGWHYYDWR